MLLYKRSTLIKLFSLRITFVILLYIFVTLLFKQSDYSILAGICLCTLACFSVTDIIIFDNSFQIKKYYISAIIPIKWDYTLSDKFDISSIEFEIGNFSDNELIFPTPWFLSFISSNDKYLYKRSVIKIFKDGKMIRKFIENLSEKEYELLFGFYLKQKKVS
jgi:hypothetical protein